MSSRAIMAARQTAKGGGTTPLATQRPCRLAAGRELLMEAVAPDGQIEAVSLPGARFVVGVQWHPEYKPLENPFSRALFGAFSQACHATRTGSAAKRRAA